jgi:integrase/recombinase XerD
VKDILWKRYPLVSQSIYGQKWLTIQSHLGLSSHTIDAYGRALEDYLTFSHHRQVAVETATKEHIALFVHDLTSRTHPGGRTLRVLDSGAGLANATLQQRLVAVRLFYDYLIEEGVREINPVGRGRYTPGKGFAGYRDRGLIPRYNPDYYSQR